MKRKRRASGDPAVAIPVPAEFIREGQRFMAKQYPPTIMATPATTCRWVSLGASFVPSVDATQRRLIEDCLENKYGIRFQNPPTGDPTLVLRPIGELEKVPKLTKERVEELLRKGKADRDAAEPGLRPSQWPNILFRS